MERLALKPGGGSTLYADYVIFIEPLHFAINTYFKMIS